MSHRILSISILFLVPMYYGMFAQTQKTGPGIGIYPTGTETGFGYRSSKNARWVVDARITKANLLLHPDNGSFINELSLVYRIAYYEKVRFHLGLGGRADWNFGNHLPHRFGVVTPVGVEAFPFPFQNAGLFFEAAPFFTMAENHQNNIGIRTVAGFVFYFPKKDNVEIKS